MPAVRRATPWWALLAGLLLCLGWTDTLAAETLPRAPRDTQVLSATAATITTEGKAWLVDTTLGQCLHLHGASAVAFDLAPLKLPAGHYRFGFIVRTGTHWSNPAGQLPNYRWRLLSPATTAGASSVPATLTALEQPAFKPVRESGEPDSWANWYGTVQASRLSALKGNETVEIANLDQHGGVIEFWIQPVSAANTAAISLHVDAPLNAFSHGTPPAVRVRLAVPEGLPRLDATLAVEWLDLLTAQTATSRSRVALLPGKTEELTLTPDLKPGVYRIRARIEGKDGAGAADELLDFAQILVARSPARSAEELPDDWPLGAHVDKKLPPMPGFRWFRYFVPWADIHRAPGVYDWERADFDRVFKSVRDVGGRVMIAYDGSPLWTTERPRVGMPWHATATANPPDDWNVKRDYLIALIERTRDARGTLGALELCNEANTPERWRGTERDLLDMARAFNSAAATSTTPIKTIGLAVSAGHQAAFVNTAVGSGLLKHVDAVSAHFYEELMSHELTTPINNLPRHVNLVRDPVAAAGFSLPLINTESGIEFAPRVQGIPPTQNELNSLAEADPRFNPKEPWLLGKTWRPVSERRAAATYVVGTVQLMSLGVAQSFYFNYFAFMIDEAPSLPWVALGRFGEVLFDVDYTVIKPLVATYPGSDGKDGSPKALAYLVGKPGARQVIVAFGFLSDTRVGRSKHWQRWLEPLPLRVQADVRAGLISDLYARTSAKISSVGGVIEFSCGEEPVFIQIAPASERSRGQDSSSR